MITRRSRKQTREAREWRALTRSIKGGLIATACGLWSLAPSAMAAPAVTDLPTGGEVKQGTATITSKDATMNVNQTSDRAIIDWKSFNIGENATVNFNQTKNGVQNTAAMTLNRINSGSMSEIYGKINSIGSVILVNPNGVLFANGSEVNAAGIVASTAAVDADEFYNNGNLKFAQDGTTNANIIVNGSLNAAINGDYLKASGNYAKSMAASSLNLGDRQVVTELSTVGNKIMLVAEGDVAVGADGKLTATTVTNTANTTTDLKNGFTLTNNDAATASGTIILRADQNADNVALVDANVKTTVGDDTYGTEALGDESNLKTAKTYLSNTDANQIQGLTVKAYYNDDIDGTVNGTALSTIGVTTTGDVTTFTKKNYASGYGATLTAKIATTVKKTENTAGSLATTDTADTAVTANAYSLINDVYQLQAIGYNSNTTILGGSYALGKKIEAVDSANWNSKKGFAPIGSSKTPFTGAFSGNGGTDSYNIYDLNINRGASQAEGTGIGLFSVVSGNAAIISDLAVVDPTIVGYNNVGGIAGNALNGATLENVTMRKRVKALDGATTNTANKDNVQTTYMIVGGIVGNVSGGVTIKNAVNGGQVTGKEVGTGGVAGYFKGNSTTKSYAEGAVNKGYYSADGYTDGTAEDVTKGYGVVNGAGGLFGTTEYATITNSWSNGQVTGVNGVYVGGLVGYMGGNTTLTKSYNSNEAEPGKGTIVTSADATQSIYGKVTGTNFTGGIVGYSNGYSMYITECYNAGNITGGNYTGGILGADGNVASDSGNQGGMKIENCYNADNNTVLVDESNYAGFKYMDSESTTHEYVYNSEKGLWYDKTAPDTLLNDKQLQAIAPMSGRLYNTRLLYRDATVTSTGQNAGGIVGYLHKNSTVTNTYSAGKIYSTDTKGGIGAYMVGGTKDGGTSFYVTTQNINGSLAGDATAAHPHNWGSTNKKGMTLWEAQNFKFSDADGIWYYSPGSTTPLLKNLMTGGTVSATSKQYVYDGTSHHLDTSGIDGYYGSGAFSTGLKDADFGQGINVKSDGVDAASVDTLAGVTYTQDDADATNSSFYKYANSNLWSGQHGYMMDDSSGVVVTAKALDVTIADNTKTYGATTPDTTENLGTYDNIVAGDTMTALTTTELSSDGLAQKAGVITAGYELTVDKDALQTVFDTASNGNYVVGTVTAGTLTVNPREISVTVNGATKTYGETAAELDAAFMNLVDGDSLGTIDASYITSNGIDAKADVGSYDMTLKADGVQALVDANPNYKLADGGLTIGDDTKLTVNARTITFDATKATKSYGDDTLTGGFVNLANGDTLGPISLTNVTGVTAKSDAGKHTITVTEQAIKDAVAKNSNYTLDTTSGSSNLTGEITVDPRTVSYVLGNTETTYGTAAATYGGFTNVAEGDDLGALTAADVTSADGGLAAKANKGTYTIEVADLDAIKTLVEANSNYELSDAAIAAGTLTINPKAISFKMADQKISYGDTALKMVFDTLVDGDDLGSLAASDLSSGAGALSGTANAGESYTIAVDKQTIKDLVAKNANYSIADGDIDTTATTVTIAKRALTLDIEGLAKTYGDDTVDINGHITGLQNDDSFASLGSNYITSDGLAADADVKTGGYAMTLNTSAIAALINASDNYTIAAGDIASSGTLTVTARSIGFGLTNTSSTYGDAVGTLAGFTNLGKVKSDLSSVGNGVLSYTDSDGNAVTLDEKTSAGTYTVAVDTDALQALVDANPNYTLDLGKVAGGTYQVGQRALTFNMADQKVNYGDTAIKAAFGNVANGDDLGSLSASALTSGSDALSGSTNAGTEYTIAVSADAIKALVAKNSNYTIADGDIDTGSASIEIGKRAISYVVDANQSLQYGDAASTGHFEGLVGTDDLGSVGADKLTTTGTKNAGDTYTISFDKQAVIDLVNANGNGNYEIVVDNIANTASVTVAQRKLTYAVGDLAKTYGDSTALTGSFGNLVDGESLGTATATSDGLSERAGVGTYTITVSKDDVLALVAKNNNYTIADSDISTTGSLTVNKRDVSYSVGEVSREFVSDSYTRTDSATGIMSWDADKLASITYTTDATMGSSVGTGYGITATTDAVQAALGDNYNVTDVTSGNLTITPATVYYKADPTTYSTRDGELALTGSLVKADGTVIGSTGNQQYLTDADYAALRFIVVDETGAEVADAASLGKGSYSIVGTGITANANYALGSPSDWYVNNGVKAAQLDIRSNLTADVVPELSQYEGAKDSFSATQQTGTNGYGLGGDDVASRRSGIIGGAIPATDRVQFSFKSVESTGINVGTAPQAIYEITIAPSSYASVNGGGSVTMADEQTNNVRVVREDTGAGEARRPVMTDEQENHVTMARDAAGAARAVGMTDAQENHVSMATSADSTDSNASSDEDEQKKA